MYPDVYRRMNFQRLVRLQSGFVRYMSHSFGVSTLWRNSGDCDILFVTHRKTAGP